MLQFPDGKIHHLIFYFLPFSRPQLLGVFERYNDSMWLAEIIAFAMGVAITVMLIRNSAAFTRMASWGLALMWIGTGAAFLWSYFPQISKSGLYFAPFFVVEGLLLIKVGASGAKLRQQSRFDWPTTIGFGLVVYALLAYPLVGLLAGDRFSSLPMFGVTPGALTLFTLGIFLMADRVFPRALWYIPLLWTIIGGMTGFIYQLPQDWLLLVSGLLAIAAIWKRLPKEALAE